MFNNSKIQEYRDNQCISYFLQDIELFVHVGYKVLRAQEQNGFINCTKITFNGKPKLVYNISNHKALKNILCDIRGDLFLMIINDLMQSIIEIKNNGFMKCENIVLDFNSVFVDYNNYKVNLVYLPINMELKASQDMVVKNALKINILKAIEENKHLQSQSRIIIQLCNKLSDITCTLEKTKEWLNETCNSNFKKKDNEEQVILENILFNSQETVNKYINKSKKMNKKKTRNSFIGKIIPKKISKSKKIENQNNEVCFQEEIEGGDTEILDEVFSPTILLVGIKTTKNIELPITKSEFIIGKKEELVDGVIKFNNAISRRHCKIIYNNGKYSVIDMKSSNGTYVNGVRIETNQKRVIKIGDELTLANSNFIVKAI